MRTTDSYPGYNQPNDLFYDLISVSGLPRRDHDSIQFAIMKPIDTPENTTAAYQLNGSIALFCKTKIPDQEIWLNDLKTVTELNGSRILLLKTRLDTTVQFLVITCPRCCSNPHYASRWLRRGEPEAEADWRAGFEEIVSVLQW